MRTLLIKALVFLFIFTGLIIFTKPNTANATHLCLAGYGKSNINGEPICLRYTEQDCRKDETPITDSNGKKGCFIPPFLDDPKLPSATDTRSELDLKNSGFTAQNLPTIIISKVFPVVLVFAGFLAVVFIVISGIQFISSNGDPKGAEAARTKLTFAIIGFIIVILAFLITQIIDRIFLNSGAI